MRPTHRFVSAATLLIAALSALPSSSAVVGTTTPEDGKDEALVLDGLPRSALVALLGPPDKAKQSPDGETLTFKLLTVGERHVPAPDERPIDLPGVGRCVRRIPRPVEGYSETIEFEPTAVTEKGHMEGGNLSQTRSSSRTVKLDEPRPEADPTVDDRTGKVRLIVTLGRDGTVLAWRTKGGR